MNNIFDGIPKDIGDEVFEQLIENDSIKIERIISRGHASPETQWYDQVKNEWVVILQGGATIIFSDATSVKLKTGDYINIPAHKRHRVECTEPAIDTIWLAVHY